MLEEARRGGSVYYTYHIYLIVAVSAPLLPRRCSQPCSPGATSWVVHLLTSPILGVHIAAVLWSCADTVRRAVSCCRAAAESAHPWGQGGASR